MVRLISIALLSCITLGTPVAAEENVLKVFAGCAGRFSAQMEHEWLMNDPAAENSEAARATMVELIDSLVSDDGRQVLGWRIDAKYAQASLLTRATFNDDPEDAAWALNFATDHIAACRSLLLS